MEDAGSSVLELVCSVLAGSAACAGSQADAAACGEVPAAYVYTLRAQEDAERAALEAALDVVVGRLQGPDLCALEAGLGDDGTMTLRIVALPGAEPLDAAALTPGVIEFYEVDQDLAPGEIAPGIAVFPDRAGAPVTVKWEPLLPPDPIADAVAVETEVGWGVSVSLGPEAGEAFFAATTALVGRPIAITVDNVVLMYPVVREPIASGSLMIQSAMDRREAVALAAILRGGRLPEGIELELVSVDTEPVAAQ